MRRRAACDAASTWHPPNSRRTYFASPDAFMIRAVGPLAAAGDTAAGVAGTRAAAGVTVGPTGATDSGTTATAIAGEEQYPKLLHRPSPFGTPSPWMHEHQRRLGLRSLRLTSGMIRKRATIRLKTPNMSSPSATTV